MAVHFDTERGIYADDAETVRNQVKQLWTIAFAGKGELNTSAETPQGQLIDSMSAAIIAKDSELLYLFNQFNPETASGIWQEAIARIYFLNKKMAEGTVVKCQCKGMKGTTIPANSIVQDSNGNQYANNAATIIGDDGTVTTEFTCTTTGPIECAANMVQKIVTVVPGWDSVDNEEPGVVGRDTEGQGSFEQRRYATVAANAHGTAYALEGALKTLESVIDAKVLDNRKDEAQTLWGVTVPRHSVSICVLGGTDADIAKTIYERLDAGVGTSGTHDIVHIGDDKQEHSYSIIVPDIVTVFIKVTINYTEGTSANVEEEIRNAVYKDFIGEGTNPVTGLAQIIYASRFAVPVIQTAGVPDLVGIEIKRSDGSYGKQITLDADEYPVLPNDKDHIIVVKQA